MRSSGLFCLDGSRARISQSGFNTGGGAAWTVDVA
jgi:hypothetical protein